LYRFNYNDKINIQHLGHNKILSHKIGGVFLQDHLEDIKLKSNRAYKDSVFTTLFNDPEKMLELYNALNKTSHADISKIQVRTLTDVLYKAFKNDIAFTYDDKIVILIEHQSTINENMPLRLLMYIARTYEKIVDNKPIYHKALIKIPTPEIIVLYNGEEDYALETILKLSDAYEQKQAQYCLELEVKVININYDKGNAILAKCEILKQYSYFINKIRSFVKLGYSRDMAIQNSIDECIKENILREFLKGHGAEVCNMLYAEYDIEEALKASQEDGMLKGRQEAKIEAVKRLIKLNKLTFEDIADSQGLPLEVVKEIADKMMVK
jgi:predicted transposase/invertase (TIGR01784 family)